MKPIGALITYKEEKEVTNKADRCPKNQKRDKRGNQ